MKPGKEQATLPYKENKQCISRSLLLAFSLNFCGKDICFISVVLRPFFGMSGDLSALVARLEAVTTRLEAAADKTGGGASEGKVVKFKAESNCSLDYVHQDIVLD